MWSFEYFYVYLECCFEVFSILDLEVLFAYYNVLLLKYLLIFLLLYKSCQEARLLPWTSLAANAFLRLHKIGDRSAKHI